MYLALYRKWRPKTFEDVISQPHITVTLKNEVKNNKTAHAYLFTGPRGTGKTTCSKILSMAVNCKNPVDGNPCMECDTCLGIDQGSILDVVEIDAASNNGVDNIRQLRDEASYTPSQCKYRVYIIDEAHMLSTGAFNALLKIMEEPPSHVLFILATTEAHKVPATILSRCQRFDFRRIKSEDIVTRLMQIAQQEEGFTLQEDAAAVIARLADGGMRDALSLLDQCIAYSAEVTTQIVVDAAGIVGKEYLYEITDCLLIKDASTAVMLVDKLYTMSKDLQSLLEDMIHHFRNIMLTKTLKDPTALVAVLPEEQEKLNEYGKKFALSDLLYLIAQLQECLDKMGKSMDRRLTFELCLIKLCTPNLNTENNAIIARLEQLEAMIKSGSFVQSAVSSPKTQMTKNKQQALPSVEQSSPTVTATTSVALSPDSVVLDSQLTPLMEWAEIMDDIKKSDQPLWGMLHGSRAFIHEGFLYIESPLELIASMMRQEGNARKVVEAVAAKTGVRYKIRIKRNTQLQTDATAPDLLSDVLGKAKELGVEVREDA